MSDEAAEMEADSTNISIGKKLLKLNEFIIVSY